MFVDWNNIMKKSKIPHPKVFYRPNTIPCLNSNDIYHSNKTDDLKIHMELQNTEVKANKAEVVTLLDFKIYFKAVEIKI